MTWWTYYIINMEQISNNIFMDYGPAILARKLWLNIHHLLIIYDFVFVVITTRFYKKTYN